MTYRISPSESLVETKTCKHCGASFPVTDKDLEFYDKISPVFAGVKHSIPTPTLCPDCRQQRRLSFRNERNLYKRNCDATGKSIISVYSPDKAFKVYHQDFWWSDKWAPLDYWREMDFSRNFFQLYGDLLNRIPRLAMGGFGNENCEYTNLLGNSHNCYYTISWVGLEEVYYGFWIAKSQNLCDCTRCFGSSELYDCIDCHNCHSSRSLIRSRDCDHSEYLQDCVGCSHCVACSGLRNASYCIRNTAYDPKEYAKRLVELSTKDLQKLSREICRDAVVPAVWMNHCDLCTGDQMVNSKWSRECFDSEGLEDCKYVTFGLAMGNCMDVDYDSETQYALEEMIGYQLHRAVGANYCNMSQDIFFCTECISCKSCFWCAGLKNASYCVLNKQYAKEEYEELVPKIIEHMRGTGEWGEFFPSSISPFGYNETVAQEYFPMAREKVLVKGFNWSDYEPPFPKVEKTIPASKLPDDIAQVPDDILNWAIECEVTSKPFRIIKQELEFYRKHNLPIPRRHPDQRHLDRMALRNPRKLFERKCDKCGEDMATTYALERPEKVYCEKCYAKEVAG